MMFRIHLSMRSMARRSQIRLLATPCTGIAEKKEADPMKEFTALGNVRQSKRDVFHYTERKSGAGYSHYSSSLFVNRPYIWPPLRKLFNFNFMLVLGLFSVLLLDVESLYELLRDAGSAFRPEASQNTPKKKGDGGKEGEDDEKKNVKNPKIGFRERRIMEYEDRLRMYSTPEKIFRYFATLKVVNENDPSGRSFEVFMTPEDFVRSFTPGVMQPRRYGLDKFGVYDPHKYRHNFSDPESIFYKLGEKGLISFSDYLFLMTLLSTSPKDFELAFQIFDTNGDGALDIDEFRRVQFLVMSQTQVGQKHRDHSTASSSFREGGNSILERYFFGHDRSEQLTPQKFLLFQAKLHRDVLQMEWGRRMKDEGREDSISYESFAEMLLQYAQIPEKKKRMMMKRLRKKVNPVGGVSAEQVLSFFHVLFHIDDIETALHFHRIAGVSTSPSLLRRVARRVSGVEIPDDIIFVVTTLFDENGDGLLSNQEFIDVVRRRLQRGLERPRDTGLFRLVDAISECVTRTATATAIP